MRNPKYTILKICLLTLNIIIINLCLMISEVLFRQDINTPVNLLIATVLGCILFVIEIYLIERRPRI